MLFFLAVFTDASSMHNNYKYKPTYNELDHHDKFVMSAVRNKCNQLFCTQKFGPHMVGALTRPRASTAQRSLPQ